MRYTDNHSTGSVEADQESTIDRLLGKYGLTNCNPAKVPMRSDTDVARLPISPLAEKTTMKSAFCMLVGELMYIAINTPRMEFFSSVIGKVLHLEGTDNQFFSEIFLNEQFFVLFQDWYIISLKAHTSYQLSAIPCRAVIEHATAATES